MGGGGKGEGTTLEFTPTWVVAVVCTVIVAISLAIERLIHFAGKYLKKKNQKPPYEALQKVKEELMLLGFISLMLTVFQDRIVKLCVFGDTTKRLLPCSLPTEFSSSGVQVLKQLHIIVACLPKKLLVQVIVQQRIRSHCYHSRHCTIYTFLSLF